MLPRYSEYIYPSDTGIDKWGENRWRGIVEKQYISFITVV